MYVYIYIYIYILINTLRGWIAMDKFVISGHFFFYYVFLINCDMLFSNCEKHIFIKSVYI